MNVPSIVQSHQATDSKWPVLLQHSDWCGELTAPKNGRSRFVGMGVRDDFRNFLVHAA